jgi:hypothetical protein
MYVPFMQVHDVDNRNEFTVLIGTDEFLPGATRLDARTLDGQAAVLCCRGGERIPLDIAELQLSTSLIDKRNLFLKVERVDLAKDRILRGILLVPEEAVADQSRYARPQQSKP